MRYGLERSLLQKNKIEYFLQNGNNTRAENEANVYDWQLNFIQKKGK